MPITEAELADALKTARSQRATGRDGIKNELLKNLVCHHELLRVLFNKVLASGEIPSSWKLTDVIALHKPNKPGLAPGDYRPIALLSCTLKLLELVLTRRLQPTLEEHVPPEQH